MRKSRGLSLVEMLVAAVISALIATALANAFYVVVHYELTAPDQQQAFASKIRFEDRMRQILQAAYLSPTATDQTTYLIGTEGGQNPNGQPNLTAALAAPGSTSATQALTAANSGTTNAESAIGNGSADGIVLSVLGQRLSPTYLEATGVSLSDDGNGGNNTNPTGGNQNFQEQQSGANGQSVVSDFPTLNSTYGSQGGIAEIAISMTAIGNPGQFANDVYIRTQRPSDADYTQGGTEQVFDPNVSKLQFEFFDGLQWDGGWDTTSTGGRHLPAAIRVHYWLKSDPNTENVFVVWIPLSDLTPAQPLSSVATTSTTTTGGTAAGGGGRTTPGASDRTIEPLPGIIPSFSNLEIIPDGPDATPVDKLDAATLFGSEGLTQAPQQNPNSLVAPGQVPDWQEPPGPFDFRAQSDPLAPGPTPNRPAVAAASAQALAAQPPQNSSAQTLAEANITSKVDSDVVKSGSAIVADGAKKGGDH